MGADIRWQQRFDTFGRALHQPTLGVGDLARLAAQLDESPIPHIVDLSLFAQLDNPKLIDRIQRVGKLFYQRGGNVTAGLAQ